MRARIALERLLLAAFLYLGPCYPDVTGAQEPLWGGDLTHRIDSLAQAMLAEGMVSGLSVGVKRGEDLLLAQGYGYADLENRVPAGPQTVYGIGSVTKQFTAAAVMKLVEEGALSLDDPITRHLPDYPTRGQVVTIRHLLTHTSGIWSYPREDTPYDSLAVDLSDEELRARFEDVPFDFAPGESFGYSNSAYLLLGMIIGSVSGHPYPDYMREHVFVPLGLTRTRYCDHRTITPGRARGYWIEEGELVNAAYLSMTHPGAAGALCSTVLDLLSWSTALRSGRLISTASYEQMVTPAVLNDGREVPYGFGLRPLTRLEGHRSVSHSGGVNGYTSQLDYYPDADLDIVVISNTNGRHVQRFADTVAKWALGIPVPVIGDEPRSLRELELYAGVYLVNDREWTVVQMNGSLFLDTGLLERARLKAQPDGSFVPANNDYTRLTFVVDDVPGPASRITVYQCVPLDHERCRTLEAPRVGAAGGMP